MDGADPPGSPFFHTTVIDDILVSDERVAPIFTANHTPPDGIFNVNGTIEKYRITVDTPRRTVVAVEPVETFPSWCYPTVAMGSRTVLGFP